MTRSIECDSVTVLQCCDTSGQTDSVCGVTLSLCGRSAVCQHHDMFQTSAHPQAPTLSPPVLAHSHLTETVLTIVKEAKSMLEVYSCSSCHTQGKPKTKIVCSCCRILFNLNSFSFQKQNQQQPCLYMGDFTQGGEWLLKNVPIFSYGKIQTSINISIDGLQPTCSYQLRVSRGPHNTILGYAFVKLV